MQDEVCNLNDKAFFDVIKHLLSELLCNDIVSTVYCVINISPQNICGHEP